jgi:N-hydroxyarylamine O-acetyltransferase
MSEVDLDAYFRRVGYDGPREPTLEVLTRLQGLHPQAIPFENIDVLLGRGVSLEPAALQAKLIEGRRGGYCFEQNGLFKRVLEALGFAVEGRIARVVWNAPPDAPTRPRTHKVLSVTIDGRSWLADVGFGGCVLTAPLRWALDAEQETPHDRYRLRQDGEEVVQEVWREGEWRPTYRIGGGAQAAIDYELANWWTSTHPTSHFRAMLIATRIEGDARFALLNDRLTVRTKAGERERRTLDASGVEHALRDTFGLTVEPDWRPAIERAVAMGAP